MLADVNANVWVTTDFWDILSDEDCNVERRQGYRAIRDFLSTQECLKYRNWIVDRHRTNRLVADVWLSYLRNL